MYWKYQLIVPIILNIQIIKYAKQLNNRGGNISNNRMDNAVEWNESINDMGDFYGQAFLDGLPACQTMFFQRSK